MWCYSIVNYTIKGGIDSSDNDVDGKVMTSTEGAKLRYRDGALLLARFICNFELNDKLFV